MICISVTPESRQLAKVDLLNASRFGDVVELCLDRLKKSPDIGELMKDIDKPIIVSCRRREEGGEWDGTEDERIGLLKQAIISEPAYVELDFDAAAKIPRFGGTKRVIAYTNLTALPDSVNDVFDEAWKLKADVVKFTWLTQRFEQTWPLLRAVAEKRETPVVGLGIGRGGVTFSLLGRLFNSPWIYAALEKGMEAFPGQTTVFDLKEIYDLDSLGPKTRFLALIGFGANQIPIVRTLNAAFAGEQLAFRCLPMQVHSLDKLRSRLEKLKVPGIIANPSLPLDLSELADKSDDAVRESAAADLLYHTKEGWQAFNLLWRVMRKAIEEAVAAKGAELKTQNVLVFGSNALARSVIQGLKRRECIISVTGPDDKATLKAAQQMGVRHIPFMNVYDTRTDVAIIADDAIIAGHRKEDLNPAFFRTEMIVADVSSLPLETTFFKEAKDRHCKTIDPRELGYAYLAALFKAISGKELPRELYDSAVGAV